MPKKVPMDTQEKNNTFVHKWRLAPCRSSITEEAGPVRLIGASSRRASHPVAAAATDANRYIVRKPELPR